MSDGKVVFDITGNTAGINSALNSATNAIAQQTAKWTVLGQTAMNGLLSAAKAGFEGIKALAKNSFEYNAQMQTYEVNFKTLLGSAEAAQQKLTELKQYAVKTPFAFTDLAQATQTLLSFGVSSENASLALKYLGDISLGDANKLQSLTMAFGQVSSAGKLAGQDLLQMINAGFNPLQIIAEETGAAYADLKAVMSGEKTSEDFQLRMEAARKEVEELGVNASQSAILLAQIGEDGMISADMVAAAMRIATSEGGLFFNALQSASETAQGQIATIGDSWDTLTGKIGKGVFDKLSTEAFPQVIKWLDELNTAYDENGFEGLKGAAGGIFAEFGTLAFNTGAGLLTQLYNGLTGDTTTTEEVKAYLSGLWTNASASLSSFTDSAGNLLSTIYTSISGQEATAENIMGTIGGLFSAGSVAIDNVLASCTTFFNDVDTSLGDPDAGTGEKIAGIFKAGSNAMLNLLHDASTFTTDLYAALTNDTVGAQKVQDFFDQLFETPDEKKARLAAEREAADVGQRSEERFSDPVQMLNLLGTLYASGSVDDSLYDEWSSILRTGEKHADYATIARKIRKMSGEDNTGNQSDKTDSYLGISIHETDSGTTLGDAYMRFGDEENAGLLATWSAESQAAARQYAQYYNEYRKGDESRLSAMEDCLQKISKDQNANADDFVSAFDNLAAMFGDEPVEIPVAWFEGAEESLQSELDGYDLNKTVTVTPVIDMSYTLPLADSFINTIPKPNFGSGNTGTDHASGGLFSAATRFLGADGMHTFGESGTEALLPLDTLWRKMGMIFDSSFAANLDAMQYHVLPAIPAAEPSGVADEDLGQMIAESVKEAVSGLVVEMDKQEVGRIVKPVVSREIENDINNRRWTA